MKLLDCTLRDGGNVVGRGFNAEMTAMIIRGLIRSNVRVIEMGNCTGIGSYEANNLIAPCTDKEYLEVIQPFLPQAEIGIFMGWKNGTPENVSLAKSYGLKLLRVGANAGGGKNACDAVKRVKDAGMICRFSMMKAYVSTPAELAEEAAMLEAYGLDEVTVMDSARTMMPQDAAAYVKALKKSLKIPVAFHGHNNLGLSVANALAAHDAGADVFGRVTRRKALRASRNGKKCRKLRY